MVLAAEFTILRVQMHPRQGYCGGGDPPPILRSLGILTSSSMVGLLGLTMLLLRNIVVGLEAKVFRLNLTDPVLSTWKSF